MIARLVTCANERRPSEFLALHAFTYVRVVLRTIGQAFSVVNVGPRSRDGSLRKNAPQVTSLRLGTTFRVAAYRGATTEPAVNVNNAN